MHRSLVSINITKQIDSIPSRKKVLHILLTKFTNKKKWKDALMERHWKRLDCGNARWKTEVWIYLVSFQDDIVSEALSGRKTIILGSGSRPASIACIMCKTKDNLYEVPCRHLICRQCLEIECKKSNQHLCFVCKKEWAKKDVIKFHSVVQY